MKNVLYFQFPWRMWRICLAGIYRYASKAGWCVQMVEHDSAETAAIAARELVALGLRRDG